jgi:lysozyme
MGFFGGKSKGTDKATNAPWKAPKIDYQIALEVACHEAIVRQAYKDSKNIWTWSVGITNASGHNVERYIGKPAELSHCLAIYIWALQRYAADVHKAFDGYELKKHEFAAALSFHYNTGGIRRAMWVRDVMNGRIDKARQSFMNWNKPAEIIKRRTKERDLFFDAKWSNNGFMTEFTRLTSRNTPDWSSGVRIDVRQELQKLLA